MIDPQKAEFSWASLALAAAISLVVAAGKAHPTLGADSSQWLSGLGYSKVRWTAIGVTATAAFVLLTIWTLRNCG